MLANAAWSAPESGSSTCLDSVDLSTPAGGSYNPVSLLSENPASFIIASISSCESRWSGSTAAAALDASRAPSARSSSLPSASMTAAVASTFSAAESGGTPPEAAAVSASAAKTEPAKAVRATRARAATERLRRLVVVVGGKLRGL